MSIYCEQMFVDFIDDLLTKVTYYSYRQSKLQVYRSLCNNLASYN